MSSPVVAETFFVTNTDPEGIAGVFEALGDSNANPGHDEIVFNIGSQTIFMTSPLMIGDVTLRAIGGMPTLDGSNATNSTASGVVMNALTTRVTGLAIRNYPNAAIETRDSNADIEQCILSGSQFGVLVTPASIPGFVRIGDGNFIYGNTFGIAAQPGGSSFSIIFENVIGINESDVVSPNQVGVDIASDQGDLFGNVISGNTQFGVAASGDMVTISDNNIGLTRDEMSAAPNGIGILVTGDDATIAPEFNQCPPNVISGNTGAGLILGGINAIVLGNRIGVHRTLALAFPNGGDGVLISGGTETEIRGNTIGANGGYGISIQGFFSSQNSVLANIIGGDFPNGRSGIRVEGSGNIIRSRNTVSSNMLNGIEIVDPDAFGNEIEDNLIENNMGSGIRIVDASDNLIGVATGNEIRANGGNGIEVVSEFEIADRNTLRTNEITNNDASGIALFGTAQASIEPPTTEFASNGVKGTALSQATIDLYSDTDEEAEFVIGLATADASGDWTSPGSLALWAGSNLNATQTDVNGNTSELSLPLPIPTNGVSVLPMPGDALCLDPLDGDEVVPAVVTDAVGTSLVVVSVVGKSVTVRIDHSVANPTAAELRMGIPGENGPVVLDLGSPETPVIAALGGAEFRDFTAGNHYLLISSSDEPAGEIRGSLLCPEPGSIAQSLVALLTLAATAPHRSLVRRRTR